MQSTLIEWLLGLFVCLFVCFFVCFKLFSVHAVCTLQSKIIIASWSCDWSCDCIIIASWSCDWSCDCITALWNSVISAVARTTLPWRLRITPKESQSHTVKLVSRNWKHTPLSRGKCEQVNIPLVEANSSRDGGRSITHWLLVATCTSQGTLN